MPNSPPNKTRPRVAVIGAGAAGLVAVREALREGLDVVAFEASDQLGGVWDFHEAAEDDPLGLNPSQRIHSSLYASLRTNLPRELMAFRDYPMDVVSYVDERQFPGHVCVLAYLQRFARDFELMPHIRFNVRVHHVTPVDDGWRVKLANGGEERFDAVMVCNGHYREPRVPKLPGMERFGGLLMHSHNYRRPENFAGQSVAVFGAKASGEDLAREISQCAKCVYWCANGFGHEPAGQGNIDRRPAIAGFAMNDIKLTDGEVIADVDAVIFCTGYHYRFPFLADGLVAVDDNWVHPLYLDLIPPQHPTLAFIGLPNSVIPFPLFEVQAKWFLRRIAGRFAFASEGEMQAAVAERERELTAEGRPLRHFHKLEDEQFAYMNLLAAECGAEPLPSWFEPMAQTARENRKRYPQRYRDTPIPKP
ncbi:NAD(P)-binding domain-containing protein [Cerasicoccus frondis]|uniref:NAD(P)-binding domain-containing protein n=1 Tax=Cerasicoccus frondis TaxID=490090 RepID=UPI00285265C2|nr:NAD(P)-binding domain-containing protein [Cerasicoccus frondis]